MRTGTLLLVAAALAGTLGTGVAVPVWGQMGPSGGTVQVGFDRDPLTMDPHISAAPIERNVYQNLYDKLVDLDAHLRVIPMLAASWTLSPDGKALTFRLRSGVKFQDGTPFNADAVKYNFDRMRDPALPSARRSEIAPIVRVMPLDDTTVRIVLEQPFSPLLYVLTDRAGMMVSPAAARREGREFALHPVGTGPFLLVEDVPHDHITLQRNPRFWETGKPRVDRIVFRSLPDDNARVAAVKAGDVDIINVVPLPQVRELAREAIQPGARIKLLEGGAFGWIALALNVTKPPFDNKLLRQALAATIDREAIANVLLQRGAYPAYSFFPNGTPAYDPSWRLPPRNLDAAREKLAAAGQPRGFAFTLLNQPGQQRETISQAIQAMAADAGIQVKIEIVDLGMLVDSVTHLREDAAYIDWSGRPDPDFDVYPFTTSSGIGVWNYAGYTNPRVQALLDAARILSGMNQRRRAYSEVTKILADDAPYLWLDFPKQYTLISTRLHGFVPVPDGMIRLRDAWLDR